MLLIIVTTSATDPWPCFYVGTRESILTGNLQKIWPECVSLEKSCLYIKRMCYFLYNQLYNVLVLK